MTQTPLQSVITRLLKDKILLGLVIAGILLVFVGAFATQDDPGDKAKSSVDPAQPLAPPQKVAQVLAQPAPPTNQVDPQLAIDFVKWWMTKSMDYNAQSAKGSHAESAKWMTDTADKTFEANYWTPEIQHSVLTGQLNAAFQPMSVTAQAVNPDGTVVIETQGTLVIQQGGPPASQQVVMDFLVGRDPQGLRITGMYNRQVAAAPAQTAPY